LELLVVLLPVSILPRCCTLTAPVVAVTTPPPSSSGMPIAYTNVRDPVVGRPPGTLFPSRWEGGPWLNHEQQRMQRQQLETAKAQQPHVDCAPAPCKAPHVPRSPKIPPPALGQHRPDKVRDVPSFLPSLPLLLPELQERCAVRRGRPNVRFQDMGRAGGE
jgi:hypothetical protein